MGLALGLALRRRHRRRRGGGSGGACGRVCLHLLLLHGKGVSLCGRAPGQAARQVRVCLRAGAGGPRCARCRGAGDGAVEETREIGDLIKSCFAKRERSATEPRGKESTTRKGNTKR